jgi:hypothetical protein
MKHTFNYLTIGLAILVSSCSGESKDSETSKEKTIEISSDTTITIPENESTHFINPPLDGVNVPFHVESISATEGGELFYESGSIVSFPPNAFVDANGNVIKGKVEVKYREFNDPVEIFLSGIPMTYDSAGVQYDFESAGMTELLAYSEDTPCFVNPESQPEINMITNDSRSVHNLYYLDTVTQQWINKGKDEITDVKEANKELEKSKTKSSEAKPIAPAKPDPSKPSFYVTLMPGALPELKSFENVTFEIAKNEKDYKDSDSKVAWTSVDVKSNKTVGLYDVTFANASKSVSYICRPVFNGADYDKAFKLFEKRKAKYDLAKKERVEMEKLVEMNNLARKDSLDKEYKRIIKLNKLISARKIQIEKENKENEKNLKNSESAQKDALIEDEVYRSFWASSFGVWNCDNRNLRLGLTIATSYVDQNNEPLQLNKVTLVYKSINGIAYYESSNLMVLPEEECMLWAVVEQKFAYISYKEFAKYKFDKNNPFVNFKMKVVDKEIKSPNDILKHLKIGITAANF